MSRVRTLAISQRAMKDTVFMPLDGSNFKMIDSSCPAIVLNDHVKSFCKIAHSGPISKRYDLKAAVISSDPSNLLQE